MSARESLIGVGLAAVLVVGIIDAAAGHDGSSTSGPQPSRHGLVTLPTSTPPTGEPTPTPSSHHAHRPRGQASSASATPGRTATASVPSRATPRSAASSRASSASLPPGVLGTFSYATTGSEETNIPGTHREFPKTTTITNKLEGCGVASTWKPIPQHVQKQILCPDGDAIKVASYETTISFFNVSSSENFRCAGPSYVYRPGISAGDVWKFKCKSSDAVAAQVSRAIGYESIRVGGTTVRTLHVHVSTTLRGQSSGSSSQDYWIATQKPVLVKESGKVDATQQGLHYNETYSLALKSLSPKT